MKWIKLLNHRNRVIRRFEEKLLEPAVIKKYVLLIRQQKKSPIALLLIRLTIFM